MAADRHAMLASHVRSQSLALFKEPRPCIDHIEQLMYERHCSTCTADNTFIGHCHRIAVVAWDNGHRLALLHKGQRLNDSASVGKAACLWPKYVDYICCHWAYLQCARGKVQRALALIFIPAELQMDSELRNT